MVIRIGLYSMTFDPKTRSTVTSWLIYGYRVHHRRPVPGDRTSTPSRLAPNSYWVSPKPKTVSPDRRRFRFDHTVKVRGGDQCRQNLTDSPTPRWMARNPEVLYSRFLAGDLTILRTSCAQPGDDCPRPINREIQHNAVPAAGPVMHQGVPRTGQWTGQGVNPSPVPCSDEVGGHMGIARSQQIKVSASSESAHPGPGPNRIAPDPQTVPVCNTGPEQAAVGHQHHHHNGPALILDHGGQPGSARELASCTMIEPDRANPASVALRPRPMRIDGSQPNTI